MNKEQKITKLEQIYSDQMCDICKGENYCTEQKVKEYNNIKNELLSNICPDCGAELLKAFIECEDKSGWYCGWLCACKPNTLKAKPLGKTGIIIS